MLGENSVKIMTTASTIVTITTAGGTSPTTVIAVAAAVASELVASSQAWGVHTHSHCDPFSATFQRGAWYRTMGRHSGWRGRFESYDRKSTPILQMVI